MRKIHDEFIDKIKKESEEFMQYGVDNFWWESYKPSSCGLYEPVSFPYIYLVNTRELKKIENRTGFWKTISILESHQNTMAHVVAGFDLFESVNQARKNGWNKPILPGEYAFKKKGRRVIVKEK